MKLMFKAFEKKLMVLLPLYLNGRLTFLPRWIIGLWLRYSRNGRRQLADLTEIKAAFEEEDRMAADPRVWPSLGHAAVQRSSHTSRVWISRPWLVGMVLGLLLFLIAWIAVPPAVDLRWSVTGKGPQEFHVYRAEGIKSGGFELVGAIPANTSTHEYRYRDYQLLPGKEVVYRIEAIGPNEEPLANEWVSANTTHFLPGQIGLFAAGLISLYGVLVFIEQSGQVKGLKFR